MLTLPLGGVGRGLTSHLSPLTSKTINQMTYGREQKEGDCGSDTLHHHSAWRTTRNICAAIMWLALTVCDL